MKTIEEQAVEFEEKEGFRIWNEANHEGGKPCTHLCVESYRQGAIDSQRWIPVEEELPENDSNGFSKFVLTKSKYVDIKIERYDFESKCFNAIRHDILTNGDGQVTHWRPIELK